MDKVKPAPTVLTIFGGTGNLTHLKLIPSLYDLDAGGYLPEKFAIISVARKKLSKQEYLDGLRPSVQKKSRSELDDKSWAEFSKKIDFYCIDFNNEADFAGLKEKLDSLEKEWGVCYNRIFYLATAPSFFPVIFAAAKKNKLNIGCDVDNNPARIVIEKPFGSDLETAKVLNTRLDDVFAESQIYRIDHFLAKEAIQNVLAFRFANEIFEPILNNKYVDHIQITQLEDIGIETRGGYYEESGALRDMIQNHLLQILAITTMNEPKQFDATGIRAEKVELLKKVKTIAPEEVEKFVVRGQYGAGAVNGEKAVGYREEDKVSDHSFTETFVAAKFLIENDTWRGVPIYMKHGKRLQKGLTQITIVFKEVGHTLFNHLPKKPSANVLTFQIKPDEGISIRLVAKKPSLKMEIADVEMEFCYASAFRDPLPDAYERLLLDVMLGDQTLFPHVDEVIRSWEIVDNILKGWEKQEAPKFPNYRAGSWGPKEADELIEKDKRNWLSHELAVCQIHPH